MYTVVIRNDKLYQAERIARARLLTHEKLSRAELIEYLASGGSVRNHVLTWVHYLETVGGEVIRIANSVGN